MKLYIFLLYLLFLQRIITLDNNREDTIYLTSKINEVFASTQITQYFTNLLDDSIELSISFPIKEEINLSKFAIKIGEKVILSKIMEKDIAEEKYNEVIENGNIGFISKYNEGETNYIVNIGNISPKQTVILNAFFIQMIGSQDMSYEFTIMEKYPTFHYKELNQEKSRNKIIKANFIIETQSKITRLIAPFLDEEAKKKSIYKVSFDNDFKKANINYIKNPDDEKNIENIKFGEEAGYPGQVNQPTFLTSFCILFRTENMNKPMLYYQYNHELNEISYIINYIYSSEIFKNIPIPNEPDQDNKISYYLKYEDNIINETPGLFIFLIDQSGSMQGKSIELVRNALLLFIKSLPIGSYFQFIGFGSNYEKYNDKPVEYNEENVNYIINIINNLKANKGGTNLGSPLKDIYKDDYYSNINLSKNILILTDGQVNNREECVELITINSNKFRIHSIGIGNSFDKILIERSGKLGKGSSTFVENIEKINMAVIDTLNKCLRPYIIDVAFNFKNYQNNIKNSIIINSPENNFSYQGEIINYFFILDEKNKIDINNLYNSINLEIYLKNPLNTIKENILFDKSDNIIRIPNGDEMAKIIIGKALKKNKLFTENINKEIELAKKYQILSKNTALYAEIIDNENDSKDHKLIKVNLNEYYIISDKKIRGFGGGGLMKTHRIRNMDGLILSPVSFVSSVNSIGCNLDLSYLNLKNEDYEESRTESKSGKKELNEIDISSLIISQDAIEGSWNENEETKKLNNILSDKINKINNIIIKLNKEEKTKIKYTILVIYYLNSFHSDKLNEYKLIINKSKKFLINQGVKYEDIIKGI